ncbi:lipopolysaccharide biosynthesis protein [Vibrio breoganii]
MKNKVLNLFKGKFVRNVIVVASGTAGAQAITMAFLPIITRLYGPEAIGYMGLFLSVIAIFSPIVALTYPIAIVLPKEDHDAKALVKLSVILSIGISFLLLVLFSLWGDWFSTLLGMQQIQKYLYLLPVAVLCLGFSQIAQQWIIRVKLFKLSAAVTIKHALLINVSKTLAGLVYPTTVILIVLSTISNALLALLLVFKIRKNNDKKICKVPVKTSDVIVIAKKHADFPLYRAPQVFINAISQSFPVIVLASFFGPVVAGYFTLARSALMAPVGLIAQSVANVFYPRITEAARNKEKVTNLLVKATGTLLLVSLVPFAVIIIFGQEVFELVFGGEWSGAGQYAQWISVWLFAVFISRPCISAIPTLSMQKEFLVFEIVSFALRTIAIYIGAVMYADALASVVYYSLTSFILYIALIVKVIFKTKYIND